MNSGANPSACRAELFWSLNPPWSQYRPPQPSLQLHCQGCWQVPCRQPGCRAHSSQRSPCQPCRHTHSPGESQNPCSSLHPAAQMADGRRRGNTARGGGDVKGREGKGERGRKKERILLRVHVCVCLMFFVRITKQLPSLGLTHTHTHTHTHTLTPLQVLVKY